MPIKYIPYFPTTVDGQAILDNITRTRRVISYRDNDKVYTKIRRGMPYYELETIEKVGNSNKNLLIQGECISACAYLKEKNIKVDLVYIDPPFDSGANYAKKVYIRRNPKLAEKIEVAEQSMDIEEIQAFEEKMYGDIWKKEDYLNWMYENLMAIKSIMSDTASIYVHLDWHIGHYVKILMDEIFGENNFVNEIVWCYAGREMEMNKYNPKHDVIYFYSNNPNNMIFNTNDIRDAYTESTEKKYRYEDEKGKFQIRGKAIEGSPIDSADGLTIDYEKKFPELTYRQYHKGGTAPRDWWKISMVNKAANERTDYSTQKPEALLQRIIKASSNEGMLVADFFGGSGVTAKVANDLNRNFIHCDVGINSIQITRDRLIGAGAEFEIMEIKDGVRLFRNPEQTMDKLAKLIPGLQQQTEGVSKFWFGTVQESKFGTVPVYVPNLVNSENKVLDIPAINRIINEELQNLEIDAKKVIVYYVDVDDIKEIQKFIRDYNTTPTNVELKDLKNLLSDVVLEDICEYTISEKDGSFEIEIEKFISDRLIQKINDFNYKGHLKAINGDSKFKEINISEEGLELIEMISLDCTDTANIWQSDFEIKIDKKGYLIDNGEKTKLFWDGKISYDKKPLRMKIRNIAGDETIINIQVD